ncbi:MAG: SET domain-containing protein-lysine N-methyltransferase [Rectinemataceae bacterium]|nr:SET domain-containing protein-lysine N-methyltransferase [Rectinemataceae bacterium]
MDLEDTWNSRDPGEKPSIPIPSISFNSEFSSRTKDKPRRSTIVPPAVEMPVCTGAEWQTNCLVISGIPYRTPLLDVRNDFDHLLANYKVTGEYKLPSTNKFLLDANLVYSAVVRLSSYISTTISLDMVSGVSRSPDPSENRGVLPVTNHYHVSFLQESESTVLSDGTVIGEVKGVAGNRDQQNLQIAGLKAWLQSQGIVCACIATVARVYVPNATIRKCFSVPLLRLVARSATAHSMVQRLGLRRPRFRLLDLGPFCYEFFQSISILRVLAVPGESLIRQGEWITALTSASTTPREVHLSLVSDGVRPRAVFCRKVKAETEYWISLEAKPDTECATLRQTKELLGCTPTCATRLTPGQEEMSKTRTVWISHLHGQDPWESAARNIERGFRVPQQRYASSSFSSASQGTWANVATTPSFSPSSAPPDSLPSPSPSSAALEARVASLEKEVARIPSLEKEVARLQATLDALLSAPTLTSPSPTSSDACASIPPPGGKVVGALLTQSSIPTAVNSSVQILAPTLVPSTIVAKVSRPPPTAISTTAPSAMRNPANSAASRGGLLDYFTSERKSVPSTLSSTVSSAVTLASPTRSSVTFPTPSDTMWLPGSEPDLPSPGETTPQKRPRTASLSPEVVQHWASPVKLDILDLLPVVERSSIVSVRESTFLALDPVSGRYEVPIGRGLFAASDIAAGTTICEFKGTFLTRKEHETRYPDNDSQYTICLSKDLFLDCADNAGTPEDLSPRCLASCANDARRVRLANGATPKPNAELTIHSRRAFLKAKKLIKAGDEIAYPYGNRFRIIPPSRAHLSHEEATQERLYNALLPVTLQLPHKGRLCFTVAHQGISIEVDMQFSQICKLMQAHGITSSSASMARVITKIADDLPCILRRKMSLPSWNTVNDRDYYLSETDGFCQFQTLLILEAKDNQLFRRQGCERSALYKSFYDRISEPLHTIISEIEDPKLREEIYQVAQRCRSAIDQAAIDKDVIKPTLTPYPVIELGFCMAKAMDLNTATFTVDASSRDWLHLTGLSRYPVTRDRFTINELLQLPHSHHVGSTGAHIHPITVWSSFSADNITKLAELVEHKLVLYLEDLGLLTPSSDDT